MKLLSKTTAVLFWPVVVFCVLFLAISGIIGARVVDSPILFKDGFALYGGIGKALMFGVVALGLLSRHTVLDSKMRSWRPALLGWLAVAAGSFLIAWVSIEQLLAGHRTPLNLALAHAGLVGSVLFAGLGCFGLWNVRLIWKTHRRPLVLAGLLTIAFYIFLAGVYQMWGPLASIVLHSVDWLLGLSGLQTATILPHTLMLDKFSITVAEYCSGVESIALFTSLYAIVGLLDWHRLRRRRYFIVFPFALLLLFLLNIVRVYGLILAGYYGNPELAFDLFHSYAGMALFIFYSAVFWLVAYKHLVAKGGQHEQTAAA